LLFQSYLAYKKHTPWTRGRRKRPFSSLRGSTICTGLDNDVYSSIHDRECLYMSREEEK
jgi:hypothetical protein